MKTIYLMLLVLLTAACGQEANPTPPRHAASGTPAPASATIDSWDGLSHRGNTAFDVVASP